MIDLENEAANTNMDHFSIPLKAIRPIGTIHFTLGVMSLQPASRLDEAVAFLKSLDLKQLVAEINPMPSEVESHLDRSKLPSDDSPIRISLMSLHSMHPPKKTSILYAGSEEDAGILYPLCTKIRSMFQSEGFLVPDDRPLKLHATIVNTIYAKAGGRGGKPFQKREDKTAAGNVVEHGEGPINEEGSKVDTSSGHGLHAKAPKRLDATSLLEQCKDIVWADDFPLERLAICKMGAKKILDANGEIVREEYEEIASIPLLS